MPSPSTQSLEKSASTRKSADQGFSLLEVIVALAIMAVGFVTMLQLFSGSIRSVSLSEQYLKAVTLANSKLSELEMLNFESDTFFGTFEDEENYRWELELRPYETPLNDPDKNINLSEVILSIIWNDSGRERNVDLTTVKMTGRSYPIADSLLTNIFNAGAISQPGEAPAETVDTSPTTNVSGVGGGANVCGAGSPLGISGN